MAVKKRPKNRVACATSYTSLVGSIIFAFLAGMFLAWGVFASGFTTWGWLGIGFMIAGIVTAIVAVFMAPRCFDKNAKRTSLYMIVVAGGVVAGLLGGFLISTLF